MISTFYSALMRTYIKSGGGRGGIVPLNRFLGGYRGDFALVLPPRNEKKPLIACTQFNVSLGRHQSLEKVGDISILCYSS